ILSTVGMQNDLLDAMIYQYFLSVSICSMLITPFVIIFEDRIANAFLRFAGKGNKEQVIAQKLNTEDQPELTNHSIIVGNGINGRSLAKAAAYKNIPYIVLETNAVTVEREKDNGVPIIFGDAAENHILNHVNVYHARAIVVAVSNLAASRNIIIAVRNITQSVHLLVRTKYVRQMDELKSLGADEVIPEELEASIEIFSRVLHNFLVPEDEIERFIEHIRSDNYQL